MLQTAINMVPYWILLDLTGYMYMGKACRELRMCWVHFGTNCEMMDIYYLKVSTCTWCIDGDDMTYPSELHVYGLECFLFERKDMLLLATVNVMSLPCNFSSLTSEKCIQGGRGEAHNVPYNVNLVLAYISCTSFTCITTDLYRYNTTIAFQILTQYMHDPVWESGLDYWPRKMCPFLIENFVHTVHVLVFKIQNWAEVHVCTIVHCTLYGLYIAYKA